MTYEEYLRANGASEDDIKALTQGSFSGVAKRAFDKMQADFAAESEARKNLEVSAAAYEERVGAWFDEQKPINDTLRARVITTEAELAKARTALQQAEKMGLVKVAEQLGYKLDDSPANPNPANPNPGSPNFDPNKYFSRDEILQIAEREGEAIATAQDIAYEHRVLFPDRPLNFRELRQKAVAAKKSVQQLWEETFAVPAARDARAKAERDAHDAAMREEGAKAEREKLASTYGNPDARPLAPSFNPFTTRKADTLRSGKQPWEQDSSALQNDRVQHATETVVKKFAATN